MYLVEARFRVAVFFLVRVGTGCAFGVVGVAVGAHPCQCLGVFLGVPFCVERRLVVFLVFVVPVCRPCVSVVGCVGSRSNSSSCSASGSRSRGSSSGGRSSSSAAVAG